MKERRMPQKVEHNKQRKHLSSCPWPWAHRNFSAFILSCFWVFLTLSQYSPFSCTSWLIHKDLLHSAVFLEHHLGSSRILLVAGFNLIERPVPGACPTSAPSRVVALSHRQFWSELWVMGWQSPFGLSWGPWGCQLRRSSFFRLRPSNNSGFYLEDKRSWTNLRWDTCIDSTELYT